MQTLLHRNTFTHRCLYTQTPFHTNSSHTYIFTQKFLHTKLFTHRKLFANVFTRSFYTLHTNTFTIDLLTTEHFHTHQNLQHTQTASHKKPHFYTRTLLHTHTHNIIFTQRRFYTDFLLQTKRLHTPNSSQTFLHNFFPHITGWGFCF